jgi:hypothetical protein
MVERLWNVMTTMGYNSGIIDGFTVENGGLAQDK